MGSKHNRYKKKKNNGKERLARWRLLKKLGLIQPKKEIPQSSLSPLENTNNKSKRGMVPEDDTDELQFLPSENIRQYSSKRKKLENTDKIQLNSCENIEHINPEEENSNDIKTDKHTLRRDLSEILKVATALDLRVQNILTDDIYNFFELNPTRARRQIRRPLTYKLTDTKCKHLNLEHNLRKYYLKTMIKKEEQLMNLKILVNRTQLLKEKTEDNNNQEAHLLRMENLNLENVLLKLQLQLMMRNLDLKSKDLSISPDSSRTICNLCMVCGHDKNRVSSTYFCPECNCEVHKAYYHELKSFKESIKQESIVIDETNIKLECLDEFTEEESFVMDEPNPTLGSFNQPTKQEFFVIDEPNLTP